MVGHVAGKDAALTQASYEASYAKQHDRRRPRAADVRCSDQAQTRPSLSWTIEKFNQLTTKE